MNSLLKQFKNLVWLCCVVLLSGCNEQNNYQSELESDMQPSVATAQQVAGGVTKGVLVGATVSAYSLEQDGTIDFDNIIATAITDSQGLFNLDLPTDRGYLLLQSSGGEFIDETDQNPVLNEKRKIIFSDSEGLKAVLPTDTSSIAITMTTHALFEKTMREFSNDFYAVYQVNLQNFSNGLGFNPLETLSADPNDPAPESSDSARQYALLSGGLANIANQVAIASGYPAPNYSIIMAVIQDFSDGNVNGLLNNVPVQVNVNGLAQDLPTNLDLDGAINRFRNNNFQNFQTTQLPQVDYSLLENTGQLNNPPTVDISGPLSAAASTNVILTANAVDADGTIESYLWQQTAGAPLTLLVTNTATLSFDTPALASPTSATFSVTVTDDSALQTTTFYSVNFDPALSLTINAGTDQQVSSDAAVLLNGSASSVTDVSIDSVTWSQVSGVPVTLNNSNLLTGVTFTAPRVDSDSIIEFELSVTDSLARTVTDRIAVTVLAYINLPPSVNAGVDQTVDEQVSVSFAGSASDVDGSVVSTVWTQTQGSAVSLSNSNILNPVFTSPNISVNETLIFQLTVTDDDGASSSDSVSINLIANLAPTVSAGADQTVNENLLVNLSATASDTDGSISSSAWTQTQGTAIALSDNTILNPSFTAPDLSVDETLIFELTVTDNDGDSSTDLVSINVLGNLSPLVNAGIDQSVDEQVIVNLSGSASDSDGTIVSQVWSQIQGTIVTLSDINSLTPSFSAPDISVDETFIFTLTVTDDFGEIQSDSISIDVVANLPISLSPSANTTVNEGTVVTLSANAVDPEAGSIDLHWTQTAGPIVRPADKINDSITFSTPDVGATEILSFLITAKDDIGNLSTASIDLTVNPLANLPPTISLIQKQGFTTNQGVNPSAFVVDQDGFITDYLWEQIAGTSVALSGATASDPSFVTPASLPVPEWLKFRLTVTDDSGAQAVEYVEFLVDPAPVALASLSYLDPNLASCISSYTSETASFVHQVFDLDCQSQAVSDLTGLDQLAYLDKVNFSDNSLTDILLLNNLAYLTKINLNQNPITNHNFLLGSNIESLRLANNGLSDVSFLAPFARLVDLNIADNLAINNITSLANHAGMQQLDIGTTSVSDISLLSNFGALFFLGMNNLNISDISVVAGLLQLKSLNAVNNSLISLAPMSTLVKLEQLDLANNQIIDVSVMSNFTGLLNLNLRDNQLNDLAVFFSMFSLQTLDLFDNASLNCTQLNSLEITLSATTIIRPLECPAG